MSHAQVLTCLHWGGIGVGAYLGVGFVLAFVIALFWNPVKRGPYDAVPFIFFWPFTLLLAVFDIVKDILTAICNVLQRLAMREHKKSAPRQSIWRKIRIF